MANLLKLLCENFEKDLDIWWNKISNLKKGHLEMKRKREILALPPWVLSI